MSSHVLAKVTHSSVSALRLLSLLEHNKISISLSCVKWTFPCLTFCSHKRKKIHFVKKFEVSGCGLEEFPEIFIQMKGSNGFLSSFFPFANDRDPSHQLTPPSRVFRERPSSATSTWWFFEQKWTSRFWKNKDFGRSQHLLKRFQWENRVPVCAEFNSTHKTTFNSS